MTYSSPVGQTGSKSGRNAKFKAVEALSARPSRRLVKNGDRSAFADRAGGCAGPAPRSSDVLDSIAPDLLRAESTVSEAGADPAPPRSFRGFRRPSPGLYDPRPVAPQFTGAFATLCMRMTGRLLFRKDTAQHRPHREIFRCFPELRCVHGSARSRRAFRSGHIPHRVENGKRRATPHLESDCGAARAAV